MDWAAFINDWFVTFDPRKTDSSKKTVPFLLFPRQVELVRWIQQRWLRRERGIVEKSRDTGITWVCAACAVCVWYFEGSSVIGFGSRKKELVDHGLTDPDSIFWKVRSLVDTLPGELLTAEQKEGRKWGLVPNSKNGALIKGEIGDEIGRGGRSSLYFVDEFAHLEHPNEAESALSANTDTRIYVSTVNGVNLFYELRMFLPDEQIFIYDWTDDPRKRLQPDIPANEEEWYKKQQRELLPVTFASQVERDYNAAVANSFFTTESILEAENRKLSEVDVPPTVPWRVGVDAAGMGNDETIIWMRRGRMSLPCKAFRKLDGVQLAHAVEKTVEELLVSGPVELIAIERDGPGGSCADQLKYGPYSSIVRAIHTGAKLKDGRHFNLRAFLHAQGREYLEEQSVHLPKDATFRAQILAIQQQPSRGGTLLMESKEEYRTRFSSGKTRQEKRSGRSPDRLDAFLLTFVPTRNRPITSKNPDVSSLFAPKTGGWKPLDTNIGY